MAKTSTKPFENVDILGKKYYRDAKRDCETIFELIRTSELIRKEYFIPSGTSMAHTLFILFGSTGDLAKRYIFPALSKIEKNDLEIIATGRREYTDKEFQDFLVKTSSESLLGAENEFIANICYKQLDLEKSDDFISLLEFLKPKIKDGTEIVVYLSIGSEFFEHFLSGFEKIQ